MLDINELTKSREGRESIAKEALTLINNTAFYEDSKNWDLYHNKFKSSDFEYLYKYGDKVLPAKVRHYPKQRTYCDYIIARQTKRAFLFDVVSVDKSSLLRKKDLYLQALYTMLQTNTKLRYYDLQERIKNIQGQIQQIEQYSQQQPQNEEEAQQLKLLQQYAPMLKQQLQQSMIGLSEATVITEKDIEKIERKRKKGLLDKIDILAQKKLKSLIKELKIRELSVENLRNEIVTGGQYYYVDYKLGSTKPIFRIIPKYSVFYERTTNTPWVQNCTLAGFVEYTSYSNIMMEFGDMLNSEQKQKLKTLSDVMGTGGGFYSSGAANAKDIPLYGNSGTSQNGIRVARVWWKNERQVRCLLTPNKHREGLFFVKHLQEDYPVISDSEYFYSKITREWISKTDKTQKYPHDKVAILSEEKGQIYTKRYVTERYKAIVIGDDMVISGKDEIQPYSVDTYEDIELPIVGRTFNGVEDYPYSLISATKGLQEIFNIVSYHRELMLGVSGTKSVLLDDSQKPEGLTDAEWQYQIKLGYTKIQTRKKGQTPSSFNQFQVLDMSLSSSIQYLENILQGIDYQIGLMMGITRQAMGQSVPSDQVGTYQLSQQSTLLITEALFYRHDVILSYALRQLINIVCKYILTNEDVFQDEENIIQFIPPGFLSNSDYAIMVESNFTNETNLIELKQIMAGYAKSGQIYADQFIKMYGIDSVKELTEMAEFYTERNAKLQQEMASASEEQKAQAQMQLMQLQQQFEEKMNNQKLQLDAARLQLDQLKSQAEDNYRRQTLMLDARKADTDAQLRVQELSNESAVELSYLSEQSDSRKIDQQIKMLELKIEAIMNNLSMQMQIGDSSKKHREAMKKLEIEDYKAKTGAAKEHIKD